MEKIILEDIHNLIKENILPRLTQLEEEVRLLRKYTWPVCQSLAESNALGDIQDKSEFLKQGVRDTDEALMLLARKWSLAEKQAAPAFSSAAAKQEELRRIIF
jgi:hypothetical protein